MKTPFDTVQSDWLSMLDQVKAAEADKRHANQLSIKLLTENEILADQLDRANSELNFWRTYATQIETRLDMISSVIGDAREEARKRALTKDKPKAQVVPPARQVAQHPIETEDDGAAEIVANLPRYPAAIGSRTDDRLPIARLA